MRKVLFYLSLFSILVVNGCEKGEIADLDAPIIKADCIPLEIVTCYRDDNDNEECFGEDICLYVEYKKERITVEEALQQKLITLNELKESRHRLMEELGLEG